MTRFIVGMQISFLGELVDEGAEQSLGIMKEKGINTVMLLSNIDYQDSSYWGKLPHNPKRTKITSSGFFYEPHPEHYENTKIKPAKTRDPTLRDLDIFGQVNRLAHDRGMKCYAFVLNRIPRSENYWDCYVKDVMNRSVPDVLCLNNSDVRGLYRGIVIDLIKECGVDGVFLDLLDHSVQFGFRKLPDELVEIVGKVEVPEPEMSLTCFCDHCLSLARKKGLSSSNIKDGLIRGVKLGWFPGKIQELATADEAMSFLTEVPEYFEWLRFRAECLADFHAELYDLVKTLNSKAEVALDIYGPTECWKYAADFRSLSRHCDWLKPMFYSGTYPAPPLSPEKIYSETKRSIEQAVTEVDIVSGVNAISQSPDYVKKAVRQCLKAGSKGVVISWDYGLIPFENIDAARQGISEAIDGS